MEENKEKQVLRVELEDTVKKVSITGMNSEEKVVMSQELREEYLDMVTGGTEIYDPGDIGCYLLDYYINLGNNTYQDPLTGREIIMGG